MEECMNRFTKWLILGTGGVIASIILAVYGQTAIQTIAGLAVAQTATQWNSVKDTAFGDNMTSGVLAAGCVLFDGTNSDRCRGDTTNGLDVDVTRVSGSVTVTGASTPADNYANPTTAIEAWSLLGCFDGTTWDRCLNSTHGDTVTTVSGLNVASITYELDSAGTNNERVRNSFTQSTTGVVANGAGTTVSMVTTPMQAYTMVIDRTAGTTNVVEIDLQCAINNVAFVQIATITDLTNEPVLTSVTGVPCQQMRYNVVTVGAGNTLAIDLLATR